MLLLVAISTAASIVTLRMVSLYQIERSVEADLRRAIDELEVLAGGNDPSTGEAFGTDVEAIFSTFLAANIPGEYETYVTFVDGERFLRSVDSPPVRLDLLDDALERWGSLEAPDRGELVTEVGVVDYAAVPVGGGGRSGVFVAAAFTGLARADAEQPLLLAAGAEAIAAVVVAALVAWVFTSRMVRPVASITDTVRSITARGLSTRVEGGGDDELGRLATTFNDMLDRLDRAFASQREFLGDAGHELRTPITIIRGHLEVMGDEPQEREEAMRLVMAELDRMARMVDDQLTLARAEEPDFLRVQGVDLDDLLLSALEKAKVLGSRRWVVDDVVVGTAQLDPERITQAIVALADNAVAHTVEDSEIGVGSARRDGGIEFWVRDTGSGIEPDEREVIFDRFHRGATSRGRPGSGLGLSIVASIVRAHGGDVSVESSPGRGATFRFWVPEDASGREIAPS